MLKKTDRKHVASALLAGVALVGVSLGVAYAYKKGFFRQLDKVSALKNAVNADVDSRPTIRKVLESDDVNSAFLKAKSDMEFILSKTTILKRQVSVSDYNVKNHHGSLYTAFHPDDIHKYKTMLMDWTGTGKRYEVSLGLQRDLKIPSKASAEAIYEGLMKNDKQYRTDVIKAKYKALKFVAQRRYPDVPESEINKVIKKKLNSEGVSFMDASYTMVRESSAQRKLSSALRRKGYDAVLDYFDKSDFTDAPLIILDKSAIVQKGIEFVRTIT